MVGGHPFRACPKLADRRAARLTVAKRAALSSDPRALIWVFPCRAAAGSVVLRKATCGPDQGCLDHHPFKAADRRKPCTVLRILPRGEKGPPRNGAALIGQQMRRGCGVSFHQQRT